MSGTYTNLLYHIVFSTKQRIPLITDSIREELYRYIGGIIRGEGGILLEIGGTADHVHLLAKLKPAAAVSDILRLVKANSSKWANERKRRLRKFGWQDGFGAFTVSESQVVGVREYIRTQETHHRGLSYHDEFRAMLERHGVEYDERYLWD